MRRKIVTRNNLLINLRQPSSGKIGVRLRSDILQPIPLEGWPLLQGLLKDEWPKYAFYYYWIENSIKWKKQVPDLEIQIYCPQGKYQDDATFVGISSYSVWRVIVFTKEASGQRLYEAIVQTSRIDWSKGIQFSGVHEYIQPTVLSALKTLQSNRGLEVDKELPCYMHIKSAEECANVEIKVPAECYLGELNASHILKIHSKWPHADTVQPERTVKLIGAMITLNKSMGLFLKDGNTLVSWVLHNEWHGLGVTHTLEAYRRRGYAEIVVNALAKRLGKQGISSIVALVVVNTVSENMADSLNFKYYVSASWVSMKKHLPNIPLRNTSTLYPSSRLDSKLRTCSKL